jgi:hypothetical protein
VCTTPGCQGLLIASLASRRQGGKNKKKTNKNTSSNLTVTCELCKKDKCWTCSSPAHSAFSCIQVAVYKNDWMQFLKKLANSSGGSASASEVLLKYEQSALDTLYFKRNVAQGNLKKCPKCSRLIEKMQGCDAMVWLV